MFYIGLHIRITMACALSRASSGEVIVVVKLTIAGRLSEGMVMPSRNELKQTCDLVKACLYAVGIRKATVSRTCICLQHHSGNSSLFASPMHAVADLLCPPGNPLIEWHTWW